MNLRRLLVSVMVVAVSLACGRLGFWQLARLSEKRGLNAEMRDQLAGPPRVSTGGAPPPAEVLGRPVEFRGRFDPRFQVLLRGRPREGEPGVIVVTPFVLAADSAAVLVERGWLAAADAVTVPGERIPDDTSATVTGLAQRFASGAPIPPMVEVGTPARRIWSAPRLDPDSLAARLPYPIAPYYLQALPGRGAPAAPLRAEPRLHDESVHLGYALQWFAIAAMLPVGAWFLARRRTRR